MQKVNKKVIFVIIALALAAGITASLLISDNKLGPDSLKPGVMFWMECKKCDHEWQIDRKEYYSFIEQDPLNMSTPGMQCPACKKEAGYLAHKCPNCDNMFFDRACGPADYEDRCPECRYSETEAARNRKTSKE